MVTPARFSNDKQQKARILVVDDEYDAALTLKAILEEEEFEVDIFNDPKLALSKFKAGKYDLLLLDILMPKMKAVNYASNYKILMIK